MAILVCLVRKRRRDLQIGRTPDEGGCGHKQQNSQAALLTESRSFLNLLSEDQVGSLCGISQDLEQRLGTFFEHFNPVL